VEIESIANSEDAAHVTLKDGRRLQARLLVGADGADSAVRRAAGIGARQIDVGQKGIVATVRTEKPHQRTARQRFLATGPLAFLPLGDAHTSSIVWSAAIARAEVLMGLDDAAFAAELQAALGHHLGAIVSVSRRQAFALALTHAQAYTAARVALIGDAAHTVHPLAGQGVNLGLMDAAVLAQLLRDGAARRDIGAHELLRRYERARKGENLGMIAVTGGFKYLFGSSWTWVRRLRGLGFGLVDAATPLKHAMMRRAAGLDGDLPGLARSQR
jgi:2-octaprenylphenol hydroxylase